MAPVVVAAGAAALLAVDIAETVLIQTVGQLVASVISSALAPELLELQQESFKLTNTRALDPALSIDAFIKGHRSEAQSKDDVGAAGYDGELWQAMADVAGEPIPLLLLAEAWRRGIVDKAGAGATSVSLEQGIRESRLKNKWIPVIEALQFQLPPIGTIVEGALRAQITIPDAVKLAYKAGVDEATFTLMFKASGRPPSPQELFTLLNRGVIEETGRGGDSLTLEQGYLETDLKDKWYEKWKALREYRPPPRTITALHRAGALNDAEALDLYKQEGLTAAMAAKYVKTAHHERSAAAKELTKAEWLAMYVDQAITAEELRKRLTALGFAGESADLEIQLADLKISHALEQRAVSRVGSLYTGRRIDEQQVTTALAELKVPAAQSERLLKVWKLERADNLKHLTPVEIATATREGIFDVGEGMAEIVKQGYGPRDAWIILATHKVNLDAVPMPSDNLPPN
jgi:hypothetical protein